MAALADGECPIAMNSENQVLSSSVNNTVREIISVCALSFLRLRLVASYVSVAAQLVLPDLMTAGRTLLNILSNILKRQLFYFPALSVGCAADRRKRSKRKSMEADNEDVNVEVLYEPKTGKSPRADVIFVHGLHGGPEKTWRQGNYKQEKMPIQPQPLNRVEWNQEKTTLQYQEEKDVKNQEGYESYSGCWPRDWLPLDCPGVRVITVNYSTDPMLWRPLGLSTQPRPCMFERSCKMIDQLRKIGVGNNPIIWVGHSKGGLFVKQILVHAQESGEEELAGLYKKTKGLMFYSVPHRGSAWAKFNLPFFQQSIEIREVHENSPIVLELHKKFLAMVENKKLQAEVCSFTETVQTFMKLIYIQIVSVESADVGIGELYGAPLDHTSICKPANRQCCLYKELTSLINRSV